MCFGYMFSPIVPSCSTMNPTPCSLRNVRACFLGCDPFMDILNYGYSGRETTHVEFVNDVVHLHNIEQ